MNSLYVLCTHYPTYIVTEYHTGNLSLYVNYVNDYVIVKNEKNEVVRYKARLVAQGLTQIPGVDYKETYSHVVDAVTLRFFFISLTTAENL